MTATPKSHPMPREATYDHSTCCCSAKRRARNSASRSGTSNNVPHVRIDWPNGCRRRPMGGSSKHVELRRRRECRRNSSAAATRGGRMKLDFLSPPAHPEMLGQLGRYQIEQVIGAGGMGIVLKGFDTDLNRPVADQGARAAPGSQRGGPPAIRPGGAGGGRRRPRTRGGDLQRRIGGRDAVSRHSVCAGPLAAGSRGPGRAAGSRKRFYESACRRPPAWRRPMRRE